MDYSQYKQLEFRRKFLKLFGAEISVFDPATNQLVGFIKMKAWKLREDIRLYRDSSLQQEVFRISARQIIDFGATYDVFDSSNNQQIVSLRRKGLKSTFVRDKWLLLDSAGNQIGSLDETSGFLALARRWIEVLPFGEIVALVLMFVSQTFTISIKDAGGNNQLAANLTHRKNPFIVKMGLDTSQAQATIDPRIPVAAAALLSVIDATNKSN